MTTKSKNIDKERIKLKKERKILQCFFEIHLFLTQLAVFWFEEKKKLSLEYEMNGES